MLHHLATCTMLLLAAVQSLPIGADRVLLRMRVLVVVVVVAAAAAAVVVVVVVAVVVVVEPVDLETWPVFFVMVWHP
jgi:hypothetical protein